MHTCICACVNVLLLLMPFGDTGMLWQCRILGRQSASVLLQYHLVFYEQCRRRTLLKGTVICKAHSCEEEEDRDVSLNKRTPEKEKDSKSYGGWRDWLELRLSLMATFFKKKKWLSQWFWRKKICKRIRITAISKAVTFIAFFFWHNIISSNIMYIPNNQHIKKWVFRY